MNASVFDQADIEVLQIDNFMEKYPDNALMNLRVKLQTLVPEPKSKIVTYAFPENEIMDFRSRENHREIRADFYSWRVLRHVTEPEHPFIKCHYLETTVSMKSGASGGPVFGNGGVLGVNSRSWDFDSDDEPLSYVIPVNQAFPLEINTSSLRIPKNSWEYRKMPKAKDKLTLKELVDIGHLQSS